VTQKTKDDGPAPNPLLGTIDAPIIRQLTVERFRGIKKLNWHPTAGLNIVLGGGNAGKTTILEAIGLLLSPTYPSTLADTDYYLRDIAAGFSIQADVSLPDTSGIDQQLKPSWPWHWDGENAVIPDIESDSTVSGVPVYRLRVRGTEDLELLYEVVQPDGTPDPLSVALRRSIGLVRLSSDDRNDRDLRLVQGSALERLLADKNLRSRIANELAKNDVKDKLSDEGRKALQELDSSFKNERLPVGLDLAVTGSPGASITSMIGLTATLSGVRLPLTSWGSGTRRLSALAIAEQNHNDAPITLVDEIERGLEPYRQRLLIEKLQADPSQTFITTHSPAVIAAVSKGSFWYVDHLGMVGPLDGKKIERHRSTDPNAFLARLAVIGEGVTEVGFAAALLERSIGTSLLRYGIHVSDGGGHETTLALLEALVAGGLRFGCFADDEAGKHPTRWGNVASAQGDLLFRWTQGCLEENLIEALAAEHFEALIRDPLEEKTGIRLRCLADRLNIHDKDFSSVRAAAADNLRRLIIEAALGQVPADKMQQRREYEAHARAFFKSRAGGIELEAKMFDLGLWPSFRARLLPFCNAVRVAVDLPKVTDV
jgi:putative ATP-dependent endonuclease of OLD family